MNEHPPDENDLRSIAGSDVIGTGRLESFSDAVMAVIITLMAFNLRPPVNDSLRSWRSGYRRC
jgi:uncharacterized membrane protein